MGGQVPGAERGNRTEKADAGAVGRAAATVPWRRRAVHCADAGRSPDRRGTKPAAHISRARTPHLPHPSRCFSRSPPGPPLAYESLDPRRRPMQCSAAPTSSQSIYGRDVRSPRVGMVGRQGRQVRARETVQTALRPATAARVSGTHHSRHSGQHVRQWMMLPLRMANIEPDRPLGDDAFVGLANAHQRLGRLDPQDRQASETPFSHPPARRCNLYRRCSLAARRAVWRSSPGPRQDRGQAAKRPGMEPSNSRAADRYGGGPHRCDPRRLCRIAPAGSA